METQYNRLDLEFVVYPRTTDLRLGHNLALPALKADGEPGPVRGKDGGLHPRVVVAETGLSVVDLEEGQRGFGWWLVPGKF